MSRKVALVTGANDGIGLAVTQLLLQREYEVHAIYNSNCSHLTLEKGGLLELHKVDLSSLDSFNLFKRQVKNVHFDILINNAAVIQNSSTIFEVTEESFNYVLDVNLIGPFKLIQFVMPSMLKNNWGRIVNVSSIGMKFGGSPETVSYTVSKAGLEVLTQAFAKVGAANNVLINTVRAGVTNTKLHEKTPEKNLEDRIAKIPLKRMAEPREIALQIYNLVSDDNTFITGQVVTVSGGE